MVDDLINQLQTYSNINPNKIRILGSSNGGGLANNVFIANKNTGVDIVCAIVSHLNEPQFHLDNFYAASSSTDPSSSYCGYDSLVDPLNSRKYLSISNENDAVIPYTGGASVVGIDFLDAENAAFYIAANQGYSESQIGHSASWIRASESGYRFDSAWDYLVDYSTIYKTYMESFARPRQVSQEYTEQIGGFLFQIGTVGNLHILTFT